ncbi:S-adenosyl-L-methionine-dependent methyltransferase [Xylariales sp. PMI_506]|nr:S-adenosyl-L-methionine-dependent methyltransferase [Xylariales sp. PMI_506]
MDIGTGTGVWAFEFAEQNPSSYVIGADLSAIQPTDRNIPNCEFIKADVEDDWIFRYPRSDHQNYGRNIVFDYIHSRLTFSCFDDPRTVMKHGFNNLAFGGWIEFQESTIDMLQANAEFPGDALQRWSSGCIKGAANAGRDVTCVLRYKQWLEEIGFVDVSMRKFCWTIGEWAGDPKSKLLGRYGLQDALEGIRGVGYKMLRLAGMTAEEIETLINQCLVELRDPRNHTYGYSYVIYGRKPYKQLSTE